MSAGVRAALTALIAAIEAAATALASFAAIALPLLLVWWLAFDLGAEPGAMIAAAAGGWLLAHLVPLGFGVSPELALGFGLEPAQLDFTVSLAPLGLTLLTAALAGRAGWRLAERGGAGSSGLIGGALGFGLAAWAIAHLGEPFRAWPLWPSILVPALCYAASAATCYLLHSGLRGEEWWLGAVASLQRGLRSLIRRGGSDAWVSALPARATEAMRLATASVLALLGLSAVGVAVAVVVGYVGIVSLSQGLHPDALGLAVLFVLNLALLPVACIWGVAWFTGAGFSIGAGSSVTPFETLLGPLPAFPLLGAVPQGWGWAGGLAPALVVLIAVGLGALAGGRTSLRHGSLAASILVPLAAAALAGLALAGLAALATGAVGPERLALSGPKPWTVGALAALELGVGLVPGVLARRLDVQRLRGAFPGQTAPVGPSSAGAASAEQETVPLEALRAIQTEPAIRTRLETETATEAETTAETARSREEPPSGDSRDDDSRDDAPRDDDPRSDDDELLRAFSWEGAEGGEAKAERGRAKRDWRAPWRSR